MFLATRLISLGRDDGNMVATLAGKHPQYYEAILQLRDCGEEFVSLVIGIIENAGRAAISKIQPERRGVDIYLSDQHYAQSLGKRLKTDHGGELLVTKKLYGRHSKHGKIVYRVTVLFRKLPFKVGDVIATDEGGLKVVSVSTHALVKNLRTGKKETLRLQELARLAENA